MNADEAKKCFDIAKEAVKIKNFDKTIDNLAADFTLNGADLLVQKCNINSTMLCNYENNSSILIICLTCVIDMFLNSMKPVIKIFEIIKV